MKCFWRLIGYIVWLLWWPIGLLVLPLFELTLFLDRRPK